MAGRFIEKLRALWRDTKWRYERFTRPFDFEVVFRNTIPIEVNDTGGTYTAVVLSDWEPVEAYWATGNSFEDAAENARALAAPMIEHTTEEAHRITRKSPRGKEIPIKYHTFAYEGRLGPFES